MVNLSSGQDDVTNATYTVPDTAPNPLVNTASVTCTVDGFGNVLEASDDHSVDLFQASVDVTKECDDYSKVGDAFSCTITVTNDSSDDSPDLVNGTIVDSLFGDLLNPANPYVTSSTCTATLPVGGSCTIETSYTVQVGDDSGLPGATLDNTVEVHYNPDGFPNDITDSASESVDLVHPDFTVTKECLTQIVPPGGTAIFDVTISNTGDVPLNFTTDEPQIPPFSLNPGESHSFQVTQQAGQGPIVENQVNVTATLPEEFGLDNVLEGSAQDYCDIEGGATRTPGFWMTHYDYTTHIFEDHLGSTIDLGWKTLDSPEDVFGMFWADNARECDGSRRSEVCQAQVIGSFQLLAAILNTGLDNGAPVPTDPVTGDDLITAMRTALAAGDSAEILRLNELLNAYNNSGDDVDIEDNDGYPILPADPKLAREVADTSIADCP